LVLRIKPQCRLTVTGANDPVASHLKFTANNACQVRGILTSKTALTIYSVASGLG
jgi:hypothetical protein